jgi:hypothetical protein
MPMHDPRSRTDRLLDFLETGCVTVLTVALVALCWLIALFAVLVHLGWR